ncbi:hypothetical protein pb186bvf_008837 [Paramecium bursaria]
MKLAILLSLIALASCQNCLNQYGSPVDYWVIFKLPKDSSVLLDGWAYYYCDSTTKCVSIAYMPDKIGDSTSPLQRTVAQINFADTNVMSVLWSDQPYGKSTVSDKAHSKGILSASLSGNGFVINHSTPNFPVLDDAYTKIVTGMPTSADVYGQHYFCASMTSSQIEILALQYKIAQVITNKSSSPPSFATSFPNIYSLKDNSRGTTPLSGNTIVQTKGGLQIKAISTNMANQVDFYAYQVAPAIQANIAVETWGNGTGGLQDPQCSQTYKSVSNLYRMHDGYKFKYTKDHSKFGISQSRSNPWVCMSDINRQTTQDKRGGTALCFQHQQLWDILNGVFVERQIC